MDKPLRLAIDLDGVIHNPDDKLPGYKMGRPVPEAFDALWQLKNAGALIVIHSIWADTEKKQKAISDWLNYFKLPYDFITNIKPDCDFYIDNKALRFYDWQQTLKDIKELT